MLVASFSFGIKTPPALRHAQCTTCFSHATFITFYRIRRTPEALLYTLYRTPLKVQMIAALTSSCVMGRSRDLDCNTSNLTPCLKKSYFVSLHPDYLKTFTDVYRTSEKPCLYLLSMYHRISFLNCRNNVIMF